MKILFTKTSMAQFCLQPSWREFKNLSFVSLNFLCIPFYKPSQSQRAFLLGNHTFPAFKFFQCTKAKTLSSGT